MKSRKNKVQFFICLIKYCLSLMRIQDRTEWCCLLTTVKICSTYDLYRATGHPVNVRQFGLSCDTASSNCNWTNSSSNYNIKLKLKYAGTRGPNWGARARKRAKRGIWTRAVKARTITTITTTTGMRSEKVRFDDWDLSHCANNLDQIIWYVLL